MAGTTREGAPICIGWPACVAPGVSCLPSHVLGRVVRAAGNDFDARYGYPSLRLLKTGMRERVAANRAGETAGRGRQGHAATETLKAVYGGLARALFGTACAAGSRRWSGPGELAGVRRRAAGGCASERAPGDLRPPPGRRAFTGAARGGPGLLPFHRQAGQRGGDGGEHSATAPPPDAAGKERRRCCACRTAAR